MRQRLDACLLTDDEMAAGPQQWQYFEDPFPVWRLSDEPEGSPEESRTREVSSA